MNLNQVTLPVDDMAAAVAFYLKLGFIQIVEGDRYTRFECPEGDSTFSLILADPPSQPGGVIVYFEHRHLDHWVEELQAKGIVFEQLPQDQTYLWREAVLKDPAGNTLKLYWAGENRHNPPWRVERRG
ncbi:glyoxalase [Terasakiispira papahanaumokuakeensis]|uniref:Glyoxalase n=1 Tax=Terasakiispira papahanaumokuakeensis TaxID=197479 RepID=A0A1E2V7R4_9GAMM|nr:VOC family protein [Terasakiispira papahanaumokuakeensis]ODC03027.1 glyoxalase [Terasakiispira papahanaumokuakeensis]